jgi:hypothetical protein
MRGEEEDENAIQLGALESVGRRGGDEDIDEDEGSGVRRRDGEAKDGDARWRWRGNACRPEGGGGRAWRRRRRSQGRQGGYNGKGQTERRGVGWVGVSGTGYDPIEVEVQRNAMDTGSMATEGGRDFCSAITYSSWWWASFKDGYNWGCSTVVRVGLFHFCPFSL